MAEDSGSSDAGPRSESADSTSTGATAASDDRRAGQDLDRADLEKALASARDEAARNRQKVRYSFSDEESYKRATEALSMLDKVEQDKKSVEQQLTEKNEQLLYRASESERAVLRLRVALASGVDNARLDEFASRLRGDTEDELKADATELARLFTPARPERRSDPSQGAGADKQPVSNPLQAMLESKLGIAR